MGSPLRKDCSKLVIKEKNANLTNKNFKFKKDVMETHKTEVEEPSLEDRATIQAIRDYDAGKRGRFFMTYAECWAIHKDHHDHSRTILEVLREKYAKYL